MCHKNTVIHPLGANHHRHQSTRSTAEGFQRPSSACGLGAYGRMVRLNGPLGAGSQLD
jgi:hypothetical protein